MKGNLCACGFPQSSPIPHEHCYDRDPAGNKLVCEACHGATRCQLPLGHNGEHVGPQHLYLDTMPRVRWSREDR